MRQSELQGVLGLLLFSAAIDAGLGLAAESSPPSPLPAAWIESWKNPPLADRPLQIVHGIDLGRPTPDALDRWCPAAARRSSPCAR